MVWCTRRPKKITAEREGVKFLRLQFTDILGVIKNVEVPDRQFAEALDGAELVLFGGRTVRLAWHLTYRASPTAWLDAVVDAATGRLLYRANLVDALSAPVYHNFPGAPLGAIRADARSWASWLVCSFSSVIRARRSTSARCRLER